MPLLALLFVLFVGYTVGVITAWVYLSKQADRTVERRTVPRRFPDDSPTFEPSGSYEPDGTELLKTSENGLKTAENAVKTARYCRAVPVDPEAWGAVTVKKGYHKLPPAGLEGYSDINQPLFV